MSEVTVLRNHVKKLVDKATEKELEIVYHIFEASANSDWWDEQSAAHKKAIDKGLSQLDNGEGVSHKEVMNKYNKWLKK